MAIDWRREVRPESVADLVARKKYARAIDLVQRRLESEPTSAVRLQLANLLVQAGRGPEAVPLFMALADEFAAEGFLARAVAALKRVERIEPGRSDVESRLQRLSREQAATPRRPLRSVAAGASSPPVPAPGPAAAPPPPLPPAVETAEPAAPPLPKPEPLPEPDVFPSLLGPREPEREPEAGRDDEGPNERVEPRPAETGVKGRLRGVLRRLFGSDEEPPKAADPEPESRAEPAPEPPAESAPPAGPPPELESRPVLEPVAETSPPLAVVATPAEAKTPEPEGAVTPPPSIDFTESAPRPGSLADEDTKPKFLLPGEHPDAAPARRPRREPLPGEEFLSMPEDVLLDRVDDLIEDLFVPAVLTTVEPPPPTEVAGGLTGLMFDELAPDERLSVLRGLKLRTFEPGDILVTEGERPGGLYLLTAGGVRLFSRDADSRNHSVGSLDEGDFFGEIASRSGLPRNPTVVANASGEMLELDQASLDHIAVSHPQVWTRMHAFARERALQKQASSAREEAARASPGETFEPKLRLRVASAFLRAGQREDAVQILLELADELMRRGDGEKAVALLKKVEQVRGGGAAARPGSAPSRPKGGASPRRPVVTDDKLGQWLHGLARPTGRASASPAKPRVWADRLSEPETLRAYAGLRDCRLFDELDEEGLLTLLQRLPLESFEPGEIVLTEGELSDSVLVVATGRLKVFVRQQSGSDALVRELGEGDFLGEIGVLSGVARTATATTASAGMLLRIGRKPLEGLCRTHPHARRVLEEVLAARSSNPDEPSLRKRAADH